MNVTNVSTLKRLILAMQFYVFMFMTLIVDSNNKMIKSTKDMLNSRFDMKDMDLVDVILGIKISKTLGELTLSQSNYLDRII